MDGQDDRETREFAALQCGGMIRQRREEASSRGFYLLGHGYLGLASTSAPFEVPSHPAAEASDVGAKAALLDRIARAGTSPAAALTPPGFIIPCDMLETLPHAGPYGGALETALRTGLRALEHLSGRRFGDPGAPLLLAVRLSPVTPTPDLAPAILGVGAPLDAALSALDPAALALERAFWRGLARAQAIGRIDGGLEETLEDALEEVFERACEEALGDGAADRALTAAARDALASLGIGPMAAQAQLGAALKAMAAAWASPTATRRRTALMASERCAVIVQVMAAGLRAPRAGAGVLRLYCPSTGVREPVGRFRPRRVGDERPAVAGAERALGGLGALNSIAPDPVLTAAARAAEQVDLAVGAPHEIEFVANEIEAETDGDLRVWVTSARPQRAAAPALLRLAVGHAEADRISRADAVRRIPPRSLESLLHATVAPTARRDPIAHGISASPGAAVGRLAFTSAQAQEMAQREEPAILICVETKPEDVQGMHAAVGVLTLRGGLTSHAAVVARGLGRPCVVGAGDARLDIDSQTLQTADGRSFKPGATITLDGSAGEALAGAQPTLDPEPSGDFATLMGWADSFRRMGVRANADTPADAETARRLGVDGVGLCRTEHMFVEPVRITAMREMILADSEEARRAALAKLLPMQRADFALLFTIMSAEEVATGEFDEAPPVTIRLLDPPLHEFLPETREGYERLAEAMNCTVEKIVQRAGELKEVNPMLGKRGCRVGVAFPEIYEMQARAIFEAALDVEAAGGRSQRPEIMIPLVTAAREFEVLRDRVDDIAQQISIERGASFDYSVGIMVETPRAALRAGALGATSAFFSFGTNDLTQMTYGLSRDDAGRLMRDYVERGVFEADPFQSLDQEGVGELIEMAVERGRAANPELSIGLCGEHGGDPATIEFCERVGFDYVSCSPFRAPIARLAAAQAALARRDKA